MTKTISTLLLAVSLFAAPAHAERTFGLTTILTNSDCNFLTQIVGALSVDGIALNSHCQPGSYGTNDAGKYYNNAAISTLTLFLAQVARPMPLQSLVTNGDCEYMAKSFTLLSTAQTSITARCTFGTFKGSDGRFYTKKVDTQIAFNFSNSTFSSSKPGRKGFMFDRSRISSFAKFVK